MSTHDEHNLDPELAAIAKRLDALGEGDRASAPVGFEDRLLRATMPALRGEASVEEPPAVIARIGFYRSPAFRLAAAVALAVVTTVGGLWFVRGAALGPAKPVATVTEERTPEQLLEAIDAEFDSWLADFADLGESDTTELPDEGEFWNLGQDLDLQKEET